MFTRSQSRKRQKVKKRGSTFSQPEAPRQVVQRKRERKTPLNHVDIQLLFVVLLLSAVGIFAIGTASHHVAQTKFGDDLFYVKRQAVGAFLGLFALFFASKIDLFKVPPLLKYGMGAILVLLMATHIPGIGVTAKGSSRWVNLGIVFQPSELAKPMIVLYLAAVLGSVKTVKCTLTEQLKLLWPVLTMMGVVLLQPDLGTTIVIASTVFLMYVAAGLPWFKVMAIISSGFVAAAGWVLTNPYQLNRIVYWWNPWSDPQGKGYHLIQSMIAIGSGGVLGKGFGQSLQKLFYLPEQHTDFIFSVMAEEFGLVGVIALVAFFVLLIQRGMYISCKVQDPYLKLMAIGLSAMVTLQAVINMGVVTGTIPTTGLTLPFVSFGSSSLIVNLGAMGLLLNISRYIPVAQEEESP